MSHFNRNTSVYGRPHSLLKNKQHHKGQGAIKTSPEQSSGKLSIRVQSLHKAGFYGREVIRDVSHKKLLTGILETQQTKNLEKCISHHS